MLCVCPTTDVVIEKPEAPPPFEHAAKSKPDIYRDWPFDAKEAERRQKETAEALGVQAARTVDLGGGVKMDIALVPAGTFAMGSSKDEQDTATKSLERAGVKGFDFSDESPRHKVTITDPFYIGIHEVSRELFAVFVRDAEYKTDAEREGFAWVFSGGKWEKKDGASWKNPGFDQTDRHPVVCVSWNDARAFCEWLAKKSRMQVRLPTEAEWEYACRAGTATAYQWGDDPQKGEGWLNGADLTAAEKYNFNKSVDNLFMWQDGFAATAPGGSFKANPFGIYDMHGNVFEWCGDWYGRYADGDQENPTGPANGQFRVARGGAWYDVPWHCRAANRVRDIPTYCRINVGLRVVVIPSPRTP